MQKKSIVKGVEPAAKPQVSIVVHHGHPDCNHIRKEANTEAMNKFKAWIAKYEPVEKAILEERAKREKSKRRNARARRRAFGDLCEMTEGRSAFAHRQGITLEEAEKRLSCRPPRGPGVIAGLLLEATWAGITALRHEATQRIERTKHEAMRPFYYTQEKSRRRAMAAERRRIRMRHTLNPCPTKEQLLDAWTKVKESPKALLRFGSLMEDLECYVDNSLRRTEDGVIIGRRPGIKGWLQTEIPVLYLKYTTVMAYKAAAKRMRQVVGLRDPIPLSAALPPDVRESAGKRDSNDCGACVTAREAAKDGTSNESRYERLCEADEVDVLRARAVYMEVVKPVGNGQRRGTALMRRLESLTNPERIEEANMLQSWKNEYEYKITVRTKDRWRKKLKWTG